MSLMRYDRSLHRTRADLCNEALNVVPVSADSRFIMFISGLDLLIDLSLYPYLHFSADVA